MSEAVPLTPTESLVLEVLGARARTGEQLWTFDTSTMRPARSLEAKGLIAVHSGIVEKTYRASLTDEGRDQVFSSYTYLPPVAQMHTRVEVSGKCKECDLPWPCRTRTMVDPLASQRGHREIR